MHGTGVTQRDIKPENILLTKDWVLQFIDLGMTNLKLPGDSFLRMAKLNWLVSFVWSLRLVMRVMKQMKFEAISVFLSAIGYPVITYLHLEYFNGNEEPG